MTDQPSQGHEVSDGRGRRTVVALLATTVLAVVVIAGLQARGASRATELQRTSGEDAPNIELPDLVDPSETVDLRDVAGQPVVLNFWASWCVPCRREMPTFQALHERFDDRVVFIGVNHQDRRSDALDLLEETGVRYRTAHDPEGQVARDYGLFGMPTTVFISPDGQIVGRRTGEMDAEELEAAINELLLQP